MTSPRIIAFAGPPGCGKTSLIGALVQHIPGAESLLMDDFPIPTLMSADALRSWLDAGGDWSALGIAAFAAALATARSAERDSVVLVEAPLGRLHPATAGLIDRLVWIDTPLDIALARNLAAWHADGQGPPAPWIAAYADHYLAVTRAVLIRQRAEIMPDADLVLDGEAAIGTSVDRMLTWLSR